MLQKMIDVVVDEARNIGMTFNASKPAVICIGKNYKHPCTPLQLAGELLCYDVKAKYLGMSIVSAVEFRISIHEAKRNFSGVLTVYTINVTELIQRQVLCSY